MKAEATLQTDVDPAESILGDGTIRVSIKGDINAYEKVNIPDISATAKSFNSKCGEQRFEPNADINDDKVVNILDISAIAREKHSKPHSLDRPIFWHRTFLLKL
jgi:hypothetical protein